MLGVRTFLVLLLAAAFVVHVSGECSGDANAELGCDPNCSRRCQQPETCRNRCDATTCRCSDGFRFDSASYKCVSPDQCP